MNDITLPILIILTLIIFSPEGLGIKLGKVINAYEETRDLK